MPIKIFLFLTLLCFNSYADDLVITINKLNKNTLIVHEATSATSVEIPISEMESYLKETDGNRAEKNIREAVRHFYSKDIELKENVQSKAISAKVVTEEK